MGLVGWLGTCMRLRSGPRGVLALGLHRMRRPAGAHRQPTTGRCLCTVLPTVRRCCRVGAASLTTGWTTR